MNEKTRGACVQLVNAGPLFTCISNSDLMGFDDFICSIWTLLTIGYFVQIVECTQNRVCMLSFTPKTSVYIGGHLGNLFAFELLLLSRLNDVATKVYNIRTHALPFAVKLRC